MSGGQPGQFGATVEVFGTLTTPGPGVAVVSTGVLPAGVWEVAVEAGYGAVADTAINNMQLKFGAAALVTCILPAVAGSNDTFAGVRVITNGVNSINVSTVAAASAGAIYNARIIARRVA